MSAVEQEPGRDPFATGGGGVAFEYKVDTWFAKDILTGRATTLGGRITELTLQPGIVPEFDDARLEIEWGSGDVATIDVQVRHRQPLTTGDSKFRGLIKSARSEVLAHPNDFAAKRRRLLIVVGFQSPGHHGFRRLCQLALGSTGVKAFERRVSESPKLVTERLAHVTAALDSPTSAELYQLLSALDILALDFEGPNSPAETDAMNQLAELWVPPSTEDGRRTLHRVYFELTTRGPRGAGVDETTLRELLEDIAPHSRLLPSRRARLQAIRTDSWGRVVGKLQALGIQPDVATKVAEHILAIPARPLRRGMQIITGEVGVGKTTELERLIRQAATDALDDPLCPVPVYLRASELRTRSARDLLADRCVGLGRPEALGVFAVIDGVDEAGLTIEDLSSDIHAIISTWPHSTVALGSRDAGRQHALPTHRVAPLSEDAYGRLLTLLGVSDRAVRRERSEVADALRRPLFAILHGCQLTRGQGGRSSPAQLIGDHVEAELARSNPGVATLLGQVAVRLVDLDGFAPMQALGLSAFDTERLRGSRVLEMTDGGIRFQLALFAEWFAARQILESAQLASSVGSDPGRAAKWRFILAQAAAQANSDQVDDLLTTLVRAGSVALVPWILNEAAVALPPGPSPVAPPTSEGARRIRGALQSLASATWPVSKSLRGIDEHLNPTVGVSIRGDHLELALPSRSENQTRWAAHSIFPPRPATDFQPEESTTTWLPYMSGPLPKGYAWAWNWPIKECTNQVSDALVSGSIATGVHAFRSELTWRFVQTVLGRNAWLESRPLPVSELEATISRAERLATSPSEMTAGRGRKMWRLSDLRSVVGELKAGGVAELVCPWPPPDTRGGWISGWWTSTQLLKRLQAVGRVALDGYKEMVDTALPAFAPFLPTYLMLPARIRGYVWVPKEAHNFQNQTLFGWYIEPAEGSTNQAHWEVIEQREDFAQMIRPQAVFSKLRELRPLLPGFPPTYLHYGDSEIYSEAPASRLARSLLHAELRDLRWAHNTLPSANDDRLVAPILGGMPPEAPTVGPL